MITHHHNLYRVRRGSFGSCILQQMVTDDEGYRPREIWVDVDYKTAPTILKEMGKE